MKEVHLRGLSSKELIKLSKKCQRLAKELKEQEPSDSLCVANGITDESYDTVANGCYLSFSGKATITMDDGSIWECVGVSSGGDAYYGTDGYIKKIKISD